MISLPSNATQRIAITSILLSTAVAINLASCNRVKTKHNSTEQTTEEKGDFKFTELTKPQRELLLRQFPEIADEDSQFYKSFYNAANEIFKKQSPELSLDNWPFILGQRISAKLRKEQALQRSIGEVRIKHPEYDNPASPFRMEFDKMVILYEEKNKFFFDNQNWPLKLSQEIESKLSEERRAIEQGKIKSERDEEFRKQSVDAWLKSYVTGLRLLETHSIGGYEKLTQESLEKLLSEYELEMTSLWQNFEIGEKDPTAPARLAERLLHKSTTEQLQLKAQKKSQESLNRALQSFPDLGVANSELNLAFVSEQRKMTDLQKAYPDWAYNLAQRLDRAINNPNRIYSANEIASLSIEPNKTIKTKAIISDIKLANPNATVGTLMVDQVLKVSFALDPSAYKLSGVTLLKKGTQLLLYDRTAPVAKKSGFSERNETLVWSTGETIIVSGTLKISSSDRILISSEIQTLTPNGQMLQKLKLRP